MPEIEVQYDYTHDLFFLGRDGKTVLAIGSDAFHDLFGRQWHWEAKHRPAGSSKVVWIPFQGEPFPLDIDDFPYWQEDLR